MFGSRGTSPVTRFTAAKLNPGGASEEGEAGVVLEDWLDSSAATFDSEDWEDADPMVTTRGLRFVVLQTRLQTLLETDSKNSI